MSVKNWGVIRRILLSSAAASLLTVFCLELFFSTKQQSQTWDESCHIFAGYRQWKNLDFGVNPEHPPLLKLLATAPILRLPLHVPGAGKGHFKLAAFTQGRDFLYSNDAEVILLRTRLGAALISLLLAVLVFAAGWELFGAGAGLLALLLLVFDPNLLAHGALVTTDAAVSCFLFASVYAYYRLLRRPSTMLVLIAGVAAGCALASKHSGILVFPILVLLGIADLLIRHFKFDSENTDSKPQPLTIQALRSAGFLLAIGVVAVCVLWSFYGFRYAARPEGLSLNPSLAQYLGRLNSAAEARVMGFVAQHHIVPESYLYGLVDVRLTADRSPSYLFGKVYPHGRWFYFPAVFVIKSTLPLIVLLALVPVAVLLRHLSRWRELIFLIVPPTVLFVLAMASGLNIGLRHILPIYPFLIVLAAATAWKFASLKREWAVAIAALLAFHILSSVRAYPTYLAYSNEFWGGPAKTYKLLTDSNADWAQQLKATKRYLDGRRVQQCWFAYFAGSVADTSYYGIPCKLLPSNSTQWLRTKIDVPAAIDGPILISAATLSGYEFGPGELNPYLQFQNMKPSAIIDHGVLVFDGHFEIPLAAALNHANRASQLVSINQADQALAEAQAATQLAPGSVQVQMTLATILTRLNRHEEAFEVYTRALPLAQKLPEGYRERSIASIEQALARRRM